MLKLQLAATLLMVPTLVSPTWDRDLKQPPIVAATAAPAGTETFAVKWIRVAVPDRGVMFAAVGRPSGAGPFPVVIILHGTHGFVPQYVQWAEDLARAGFLAVAGCWFSGSENPNRVAPRDAGPSVNAVSPPIPCPEVPPLGRGAYPEAVQYIDRLVQAARTLPDARPDRLASSDTHGAAPKACSTYWP